MSKARYVGGWQKKSKIMSFWLLNVPFSLWGIYIPLTLPLKECIQVRTKLSEGQLFTFRDRQDSCLPSAARLDSPEDQGKGKVGPRKVLFLQEYNFLQG